MDNNKFDEFVYILLVVIIICIGVVVLAAVMEAIECDWDGMYSKLAIVVIASMLTIAFIKFLKDKDV